MSLDSCFSSTASFFSSSTIGSNVSIGSFFSSDISTSAPGPVVSISTVFSSVSGIVSPMINYDEVRFQDFV